MPERFSASNAAKHMACSASANLDLAIPNWVEPEKIIGGAADVGTAAHEDFAKIMEYSASDMRAMIRALEYVAGLRAQRRFKVLIEETVEATWLDVPTKTTVDLCLFTQDEIHIVDLKWGKIPVDVVDNDQLLFYAVCFAKLAPKAEGVTLHIVQPRANNIEPWFASADRLAQFMADARAAQARILAGDTTFGPSDHCKFCPANPHSRGEKGSPLCPEMMGLLYPKVIDEAAILDL